MVKQAPRRDPELPLAVPVSHDRHLDRPCSGFEGSDHPRAWAFTALTQRFMKAFVRALAYPRTARIPGSKSTITQLGERGSFESCRVSSRSMAFTSNSRSSALLLRGKGKQAPYHLTASGGGSATVSRNGGWGYPGVVSTSAEARPRMAPFMSWAGPRTIYSFSISGIVELSMNLLVPPSCFCAVMFTTAILGASRTISDRSNGRKILPPGHPCGDDISLLVDQPADQISDVAPCGLLSSG